MSESFTPLVSVGSRDAAFASIHVKGMAPRTLPSGSVTPAPAGRAGAEACAKPVVTLQRNGDVISGIRIQCGCGQVVDLACVF